MAVVGAKSQVEPVLETIGKTQTPSEIVIAD